MKRVDLEDLASGYSHRPTSPEAEARARMAAEEVALGPGDIALDIGGGRGHHAATWLERGGLPVVVDPSAGMIEAARSQGVAAVRALSQSLPFADNSVRLTYFHLSLHYGDWRAALTEARRVAMPGGQCWIWTMGEQHHRSSFLARWFPSVGDIDTARFPDPELIVEFLAEAGCDVERAKDVEPKTRPAGEWQRAVEAGFVSTLQLISRDELDRGLEAYRMAYPDPAELVEYVLTFDRIRAII